MTSVRSVLGILMVGAIAGLSRGGWAGDVRVEEVWAEPGMIKNPVAFTIDPLGRVYVVESDRAGNAVQDTRGLGHLHGVEEDLRLKSVDDRRALIEKWIEQGAFEPDFFRKTEDRVVRVRDTDGDGVADDTNVFAGGFNDAVDGIAAGAVWLDGTLYLTCIPNLWALRDRDQDGVAEERESLAYGFGVRWCFYGHDLHGLVLGPDGRIYFSMGDRGFNVTTREGRKLDHPERGGVFRCWPDGSELELFAQGLRNPQELAFDEYGNLFTGDNNCDSGDKARVVNVVEGADYGWRQDVQSLDSRGPWNRENMWHLYTDAGDVSRPAWALPPVAHVGAGPSGILYYPGTGESHELDNHILMVDFYGSGATVHSFQMSPKGAWFSLEDHQEYYKGKTVTDIAMGYDGRMYLSDWGGGWSPNPNGNIFTITNKTVHEDAAEAAAIAEVESLFKEGFDGLSDDRLVGLLGHRDQRVRLMAQYELAKRASATAAVEAVARDTEASSIARVHAVWCLGQKARQDKSVEASLRELLAAREDHVRAQAAKTLADLRDGDSIDAFMRMLKDSDPKARFYAALGLGALQYGPAMEPLLDMLEANTSGDPIIRHGASYALALIDRADDLVSAAEKRGPLARLGAVIALRRMKSLGVLAFVHDPDVQVQAEAVRAIYDRRIDAGLPAVARLIEELPREEERIEPILRRAIEANELIGDAASAERLARFSTWKEVGAEWRVLALDRLLAWDKPMLREGVWGHLVELKGWNGEDARAALLAHLDEIEKSSGENEELDKRIDAVRAMFAEDMAADDIVGAIEDASGSPMYRQEMLSKLEREAPERVAEACRAILEEGGDAKLAGLRAAAREMLVMRGGDAGLEAVKDGLEAGTTRERQQAVRLLTKLGTPEAGEMISGLRAGLADGSTDEAIALEVLSAAGSDVLSEPWALMMGGDASVGRSIFEHHEAAQCLRCHTVNGTGGTAGPELTAVASRLPRSKIVEAVLTPNATVVDGYGTISLTLADGETVGGTLVEEKALWYVVDEMGQQRQVLKSEVRSKSGPVSSMPQMSKLLTPYEIRDVVAYLATLEDPRVGPAEEDGPVMEASATEARGSSHLVARLFYGGVLLIVGGGSIGILIAAMRIGSRAT